MIRQKNTEQLLSMYYDQELNGTEGNELQKEIGNSPKLKDQLTSHDQITRKLKNQIDALSPGADFTTNLMKKISQEKIYRPR